MRADLGWWLNQIGIVVEILGAAYLVACALKARRSVSGMKTDLDSIEHSVQALLEEARGSFRNQLTGFVLVGLGLLFQFAGNFGGG